MTGLPPTVLGGLCGLVLAIGGLIVVARWPGRRRVDLDDRLAPYLRDAPRPSRLLGAAAVRTPFPTLERLLAPVMKDAVRWADRISGGVGTTRRRLDQAGRGQTLEAFRAEQVVWGVIGVGVGLLFCVVVAVGRGLAPVPMAAIVVIAGLSGVMARDQVLSRQVARREERILAEFPTVAELLALSVGAGEGAVGALERVARTCRGELSVELRRTLTDARSGTPLVLALEAMANRSSVAGLTRFVDGVAVAVERGTPLADVLRSQAQDVREAGRRQLMEAGGKKEIAMMIPVVFLVLPVTVVFALFPGLAVLDLQI